MLELSDPAHNRGSIALDARRRDLERLANEPWDLLIVGGGIVGAGAMLDAASRGLKVALVEQDDIAAGTSSRSSRLIHGGLRYLEQFHVGLVREALGERDRLLRLAPHLVRLEEFLFPLYGPPIVTRGFYTAGMTLYDLLGAARSGGRHRQISRAGALEYAPDLRSEGLRGGLLYHDATEDDARYTLAVVRTALATGHGAALAVTRARAISGLRQAGRTIGATLCDVLDGSSFDVRATTVLDATGVWGSLPDRPLGSVGGVAATSEFNVLPSRGSHLVIPRDRIVARGGVTIRVPGRVAFLVPWQNHWIVGTTDDPYQGPLDRPVASGAEVDQLLGTLNTTFGHEITRDDVVGTFAGLRPLIAPSNASSTVRVSREHRVAVANPGLVRISGGKYTTYRVMSRDAVDAVLGPRTSRARPSVTADLPIVGAAARTDLDALATRLGREFGLEARVASSLVHRHGTQAPSVLLLGRECDLLRVLVAGLPYLEAEVAWAVQQELAISLDDILARRIRLAPILRDRGTVVAPRVAAIAGHLHGWDAARQAAEVAAYVEGARREFAVPAAGPGRTTEDAA